MGHVISRLLGMDGMSVEDEISKIVEEGEYKISFDKGYSDLDVYVHYGPKKIGHKSYMVQRWSYTRGARWALKVIRNHKKAMKKLEGWNVK